MGIDDILRPKSEEEITDLEQRGFRKDKGKWRFTIDIKDIIEAYDQNEDTTEFRSAMLDTLRAKTEDVSLFAGEDEADRFEKIADEFNMLDPTPEVEEVDYVLEMLYDWADSNDVWINSF